MSLWSSLSEPLGGKRSAWPPGSSAAPIILEFRILQSVWGRVRGSVIWKTEADTREMRHQRGGGGWGDAACMGSPV